MQFEKFSDFCDLAANRRFRTVAAANLLRNCLIVAWVEGVLCFM